MTEGRLSKLPMMPTKAFAQVMALTNGAAYAAAVANLPNAPRLRILEIGFGSGAWLQRALKEMPTCSIAGIDPTQDMVELATARLSRYIAEGRVRLARAGAESIPFEDASFDAVAAIHSFQFWADPHHALGEVARVLAPKGRIILVLRNHQTHAPSWLPNPISRSSDEVGAAANALRTIGFDIKSLETRRQHHLLVAQFGP